MISATVAKTVSRTALPLTPQNFVVSTPSKTTLEVQEEGSTFFFIPEIEGEHIVQLSLEGEDLVQEVVSCGEEGMGRAIVAHNTEADLAACLIAPVGGGGGKGSGVIVGNVSKLAFRIRTPSTGVYFSREEMEETAFLKVMGPLEEEEGNVGENVPIVAVEAEDSYCTFEWVPPAEGSYFVELVVNGAEIASTYLRAVWFPPPTISFSISKR